MTQWTIVLGLAGLGFVAACDERSDACSAYSRATRVGPAHDATADERQALIVERLLALTEIEEFDAALSDHHVRLLDIEGELNDMFRASTGKTYEEAINAPENRARTDALVAEERRIQAQITDHCSPR